MDATGRLVNVPKKGMLSDTEFCQIYNYALLVKDLGALKTPATVVCEFITSRHDTAAISQNLLQFKHSLDKLYRNVRHFSLVVIDYSWAEAHAVLNIFNLENMTDYGNRVYKYARDGKDDKNKLFIASCASHTMHRFLYIYIIKQIN